MTLAFWKLYALLDENKNLLRNRCRTNQSPYCRCRYDVCLKNPMPMIFFAGYMAFPDGKVHGANMGPTWVLSAPDGPHVGPMNLAIRVIRWQLLVSDKHTASSIPCIPTTLAFSATWTAGRLALCVLQKRQPLSSVIFEPRAQLVLSLTLLSTFSNLTGH